jgi:tRNA 2-thiouridine synthesizing protein A
MSDIKVDAVLDITNEVCPMTFVKTKLKLETLEPGQHLELILNDGEPLRNVPRSLKEEGHRIVGTKKDGTKFHLIVEKGQ